MVQFTKLRLTGFKSFIDPSDLLIEPGLTGVVGPNGCGKSNLVEALRWVMGEFSAKQMRGSEMDDVIFNGSDKRPARNIAEVCLTLDNSQRKAPSIFNNDNELEVTRRIERGEGSVYSINGREVRARDVQLLFADSASGSRSTAIVSQGRISALINAKPTARRSILEEAAGITGLHSRRHEAELRLRGAETNLERLEDVLATLETQHQGLKRQARQATRYRNIGEHIRKQEGILLHQRWREASAAMEDARARLRESESAVAELTRVTAAIATEQAEKASILPALRRAEAEAAAALQRLTLARERLDEEEQRLADAREECEIRLTQIIGDIEREKVLKEDAASAMARIGEERATLLVAQEGEAETEQGASERVRDLSAEVAELENRLTGLTEQAAAEEARRAGLERRIAEIENRIARIGERAAEIESQRAGIEAADPAALAEAEAAAASAGDRVEAARLSADQAEKALAERRAAEESERDALQEAEAALARLRAEEEALSEILGAGEGGEWTPLIDEITVESGYEAALGAALGEDLEAPAESGAPVRWDALPPLDPEAPIPDGALPLARYVKAPPALARRLSQTGVVEDDARGRALRDRLLPGQRLVSREGGLWRWDGFTVDSGAPTTAATRLGQRNRLKEIRGERDAAESRVEAARESFASAGIKAREAAEAERGARGALRQADAELHRARDAFAAEAQKAAARESRIVGLREAAERLVSERAEAEAELNAAHEARAKLADDIPGREEIARLREAIGERRAALIDSRSVFESLRREVAARRERLAMLNTESETWNARAEGAERRLADLDARQTAAQAEKEALSARPQEITGQRHALLSRIDDAEKTRSEAADALAKAESRLVEVDRKLKAEESNLAETREGRVRAEATVEQAQQALDVLTERISERLRCAPGKILEVAGIAPGGEISDPEAAEKRLERLIRERENMGPVNLRAEEEAAELEEQITTLQSEREDLIAAIARLRQGISSLNREGRERLLASFSKVDAHFQELFIRLFGGGHAHMKFVESDDPLEAGLEIFASPPGKKLQTLTLLSGGEQALTALSLLFAVFLTNPAPICVLDEVDAPLDDANVDRFCNLISDIAQDSATRFLIVTHHRLTMARVDRLFGVTMMERGVSRIVSVDLQSAERMREAG